MAPLYLAALAAVALIDMLGGRLAWDDVALSALLLHAWLPGHAQVLNVPGWSLSVEWFFYLCFPVLLSRLSNVRSSRLLAASMLLVWCGATALHAALVVYLRQQPTSRGLYEFVYYHPLSHFPTFVLGMLSSFLFLRQRSRLARRRAWWLGGAAVGALWVAFEPPELVPFHHNGLFTPLFFCLTIGIASLETHWLARVLSVPALVLLGEMSYGIYILQHPVVMILDRLLKRLGLTLSADARFLLIVCVLLAVSWVGYRVFEIPMRHWVKLGARRMRERRNRPFAASTRLSEPSA